MVTPTEATVLFLELMSVTLESCLYCWIVTPSNTVLGKSHEKNLSCLTQCYPVLTLKVVGGNASADGKAYNYPVNLASDNKVRRTLYIISISRLILYGISIIFFF